MLPIKRILCATNLSEPSDEGVKAANELAEHFGAELLLVHVVSPVPVIDSSMEVPSSTFNVALYQKEMEDIAKFRIQKLADNSLSPKVKVRLFVTTGHPSDEIVQIAEREESDLIVITVRHRSRWHRLLLGSRATRLLRQSRRPVLSIQQPRREKPD
jgi:nucleotide-binding universal stress UspA family protein